MVPFYIRFIFGTPNFISKPIMYISICLGQLQNLPSLSLAGWLRYMKTIIVVLTELYVCRVAGPFIYITWILYNEDDLFLTEKLSLQLWFRQVHLSCWFERILLDVQATLLQAYQLGLLRLQLYSELISLGQSQNSQIHL